MADTTMTLNLPQREMDVLEQLAAHHDMTKTQVMRQALRLYQKVHVRLQAGERMFFSGDEKRAMEFVGIGLGEPDRGGD